MLSEPWAFQACAVLANDLLRAHGIEKTYSGPELMHEFVGRNFRSMLIALATIHDFLLGPGELEAYNARELESVLALLRANLEPCPNVADVLGRLTESDKGYTFAVVSSSAIERVQLSLDRTNLAAFFPANRVYSAASSLAVPTSKPDPAIYIHACHDLKVQPEQCLAIEDSQSGAMAARHASIPLIGYVGGYETAAEREQMALVLKEQCGAVAIMYDWNEFEQILVDLEQPSTS